MSTQRNQMWQRIADLIDDIEDIDADHFAVLFDVVLKAHRQRLSGPVQDPWEELRRVVASGKVELTWAELSPGRGLIRDRGRGPYEIVLDPRPSFEEMRYVVAHELEHLRRGRLFPPDADPRFRAEEETLVRGFCQARYGAERCRPLST